jgi:hypothetical protein
MAGDRIGILGGNGAVGRAHIRRLHELALGPLRIGTRRPSPGFPAEHEAVAFDIDDNAALKRFCSGCRIVVNCAGPSCRIEGRVAQAAFAAGADYVDPGGDESLHTLLVSDGDVGARRAIVSAGMMPGLTGLLPRWLAREVFDRAFRLTAYICTRDLFTPAAAADFLASLRGGYGTPMAAWRAGAAASSCLQPLINVALPFFAAPVNAFPYLSKEAERLAHALQLSDLSWYIVFDGGQMWKALLANGARAAARVDAAEARKLARAAEIDLFGQAPHQVFVFRLEGERDGRPGTRVLIAHSASAYDLSAAVVTAGVLALLAREIPRGIHFAADILDSPSAVQYIRASGSLTLFELLRDDGLGDAEQDQDVI